MSLPMEALRQRLSAILGEVKGRIPQSFIDEMVQSLENAGDVRNFTFSMDWQDSDKRLIAEIILGTLITVCTDSGDDVVCRKVFIQFLAAASSDYGSSYAFALSHARRGLYLCLYKKYGISVARAFEKNSLADISSIWPGFEDAYPSEVRVFR